MTSRAGRNRHKASSAAKLSQEQYEALAGFRRALRSFLTFSEATTREAGITSQQYEALLAIKAASNGATLVGALADQLLIKHNNAVQLVDRLVEAALVVRNGSANDRRAVELRLTAKGDAKIAGLAAVHYRELQDRRSELIEITQLAEKMCDP